MGIKRDIKQDGGFVVSSGTLRDEDLIPRFCNALYLFRGYKRIARKLYNESQGYFKQIAEIEKKNPHDYWNLPEYMIARENISWIINEELFYLLGAAAPYGFYFSSHEGDGACFGFWKIEEGE